MNFKKVLTLAGLLGMLLIGASVVGAQDASETPQTGRPGLRAAQIIGDVVAQETSLDRADIAQQVMQGQTLAAIIQANGGNVQTVIDTSVTQLTDAINQAVTSGTITQERADSLLKNLQDVVTRAVNGDLFPNRVDRTAVRRQAEQILLRATADATNLTPAEILQQLAQGKTLADVIIVNGGTVETVVNNAVATATDQINAAVADGRLGQDQADTLIESLSTTFTDAVNGQVRQQATRLLVGAALIRLAAQQTGLTPAAITQEIRSGKTLGAVLTENHVDINSFEDATVSQLQNRLNQAVKNGRITQEQADNQVSQFRDNLTNRLNGTVSPEATAAPV